MSASPHSIRTDLYIAGSNPLDTSGPTAPSATPGSQGQDKQRPKLSVVTAPLRKPARGLFALSIIIFVAAMIGVLVINITVANRQYELLETNHATQQLQESNEKLAGQVAHLAAPQNVASRAAELGMVLPATTASIDLLTGQVHGVAGVATEENAPTDFVSAPTVASSVGTPVEVPEARKVSREDSIQVQTSGTVAVAELGEATLPAPQLAKPGDTAAISSESHNSGGELAEGTIQAPQVQLPEITE